MGWELKLLLLFFSASLFSAFGETSDCGGFVQTLVARKLLTKEQATSVLTAIKDNKSSILKELIDSKYLKAPEACFELAEYLKTCWFDIRNGLMDLEISRLVPERIACEGQFLLMSKCPNKKNRDVINAQFLVIDFIGFNNAIKYGNEQNWASKAIVVEPNCYNFAFEEIYHSGRTKGLVDFDRMPQ